MGSSKVQGHALTIKDEFIATLIDICTIVSAGAFLSTEPDIAVLYTIDTAEKLFLLEEELLVKSIDSQQIKSWDDFEYTLAMIIENRLLQLYQSHYLDKEYQKKQKKLDLELLAETAASELAAQIKVKNKKKKKNKGKKGSGKQSKAGGNILESSLEYIDKV